MFRIHLSDDGGDDDDAFIAEDPNTGKNMEMLLGIFSQMGSNRTMWNDRMMEWFKI